MALNFCNNNSLSAITTIPASISGGGLNLISTQTASSSSSLSFTTGIDSTYKEYVFKFYNIHPSTRNADFQFNMSIDAGSNYNVTKTTTAFRAFHEEAGTSASLAYQTGDDLAQSTSYQDLSIGGGIQEEDADSLSGYLHLFEPSSTTFVKHFISVTNQINAGNNAMNGYIAGYGNTTSAVDAVDFKISSGTFDGVIKLYGVS